MRTFLTTITGMVASAVWLAAQQPSFRTAVDVVAVDVQVTDKEGRPVDGLTTDDFTLLVDGKPRRILSAEFVRYSGERGEAPEPASGEGVDAGWSDVPERGFGSNLDQPPGRLFVLVVDQANITRGGGRGAMQAATRFLDRLTPYDRVALATVPVGPSVEFTTEKAPVREALDRIVGGGANVYMADRNVSLAEAFAFTTGTDRRLWNQAVSEECERWTRSANEFQNCLAQLEGIALNKVAAAKNAAANSLHAIEGLVRRLAAIEGPKHVVLISQALVTGTSFGDLDLLSDVRQLEDATARSRVTMSVLHLDRSFLEAFDVSERFMTRTIVQDSRLLGDGLGQVAGATGGSLHSLMVSLDPAFDRVARETSASYVLAFEPEDADKDGKAHAIEVKLARKGIDVRARRSFVVPPAGEGTAEQGAGQADEKRVARLLGWPVRSVAVPLKLRAYALGELGGGSGVRLLIAADIGRGADIAGVATVGFVLLSEKGDVVRQSIWRGELPAIGDGDARSLYYTTAETVLPGAYTLRVAVVDASGRAGALEIPVSATFVRAGRYELSDLVVDEAAVRADGKLKLNVDGRVGRGTLGVYLEVRDAELGGQAASRPPLVRIDIGRPGDPVVLVGRQLEAVGEATPGRYYLETQLDVSSLEPGTYVLRASPGDGSADGGSISRTIRISAR